MGHSSKLPHQVFWYCGRIDIACAQTLRREKNRRGEQKQLTNYILLKKQSLQVNMASSKGSQGGGAGDQQVIDISQLPIQQLNQFVRTLEKVSR